MKVTPLAFDSFGVRGMATLVSVNNTNILIDPGVTVASRRFQLPPSARELRMLELLKESILNVAKECEIVSISHYHNDHYFPVFEQGTEVVYKNKIIFTKDRRSKCNFDQRKSGKKFELYTKQMAKELIFCDGKELIRNGITFRYSSPTWHGESGSLDGYVLTLTIEHKDEKLMFCPDVMGPVSKETKELIIKENPQTLIIDGPMTETTNVGYSHVLFKKAEQNMIDIMVETDIKDIILDHNTVRSLTYKEELNGIMKIARETKKNVMTAAEFVKRPINLLEARRKELWEGQDWY